MLPVIIAIIGLGYVGLPLAVEFAKKYLVIGYDIKEKRVNQLRKRHDTTLEITEEQLNSVLCKSNSPFVNKTGLYVTSNSKDIAQATFYIVTVPTPTDKNNRPDLTLLIKASETIGKVLKPGDIVIYESTVYPGATEEECVPILEKFSSLKYCSTQRLPITSQHSEAKQFYCGYSPERINPGDKEHTITKIKKVTSGSTPEAAQKIDQLYRSIITAGTHLASSIKVAEAAKVIENSQRDINIAFVNELAMIFNRLGIDTHEVLEAAGTKWNFLPFKPGLVGGHCIGVDPYYLAQKAQESGYHPEIILAGRRLNDNMGRYIASEVIKLLIARDYKVKGASILMLGITFKENCPDIRNTRAVDIAKELNQYGAKVAIYDPWADPDEVVHQYALESLQALEGRSYDAIILAVAHDHFKTIDIRQLLSSTKGIVYDVKGILPLDQVDGRL